MISLSGFSRRNVQRHLLIKLCLKICMLSTLWLSELKRLIFLAAWAFRGIWIFYPYGLFVALNLKIKVKTIFPLLSNFMNIVLFTRPFFSIFSISLEHKYNLLIVAVILFLIFVFIFCLQRFLQALNVQFINKASFLLSAWFVLLSWWICIASNSPCYLFFEFMKFLAVHMAFNCSIHKFAAKIRLFDWASKSHSRLFFVLCFRIFWLRINFDLAVNWSVFRIFLFYFGV